MSTLSSQVGFVRLKLEYAYLHICDTRRTSPYELPPFREPRTSPEAVVAIVNLALHREASRHFCIKETLRQASRFLCRVFDVFTNVECIAVELSVPAIHGFMALITSCNPHFTHRALEIFRDLDRLWPLSLLEVLVHFSNLDLLDKVITAVSQLEIDSADAPAMVERLLYLVTFRPTYRGCDQIRDLARTLLENFNYCANHETMARWLSILDSVARWRGAKKQNSPPQAPQPSQFRSQVAKKPVIAVEDGAGVKFRQVQSDNTKLRQHIKRLETARGVDRKTIKLQNTKIDLLQKQVRLLKDISHLRSG